MRLEHCPSDFSRLLTIWEVLIAHHCWWFVIKLFCVKAPARMKEIHLYYSNFLDFPLSLDFIVQICFPLEFVTLPMVYLRKRRFQLVANLVVKIFTIFQFLKGSYQIFFEIIRQKTSKVMVCMASLSAWVQSKDANCCHCSPEAANPPYLGCHSGFAHLKDADFWVFPDEELLPTSSLDVLNQWLLSQALKQHLQVP